MEKKIKFYNERVYLEEQNQDAINRIMALKESAIRNSEEDQEKYSLLISTYKKIISLIISLIKELKIENNFLLYAKVIEELLFNGYFSSNNNFKIDDNCYFKLRNNLAISIINGSGRCENIASFANDILPQFVSTDIFVGFSSSIKSKKRAENHQANHIINIGEYNHVLYGYDIKNRCLYQFINESQLRQIANFNVSYMTYKPYFEIIHYGKTEDEIKDKICYFKEHANDKALSYDDLCDLLNPVKGILKDNSSLLDYYSKELEPLKGKVKELTKKIK